MNLREQLRQQLNKIPTSVMHGGVMTASLWKAKAEKANRLLGQPRATDAELQTALYELINFK